MYRLCVVYGLQPVPTHKPLRKQQGRIFGAELLPDFYETHSHTHHFCIEQSIPFIIIFFYSPKIILVALWQTAAHDEIIALCWSTVIF